MRKKEKDEVYTTGILTLQLGIELVVRGRHVAAAERRLKWTNKK